MPETKNLVVRLPRRVHRDLELRAIDESVAEGRRVSMNTVIIRALVAFNAVPAKARGKT